jgi:hypothetical protein
MNRLSLSAVLAVATVSPPTGPRIPDGRFRADRDARTAIRKMSLPLAQLRPGITGNRRGNGQSHSATDEIPALASTASALQGDLVADEVGARRAAAAAASKELRPPQSVPPCHTYSAETSEMTVLSSMDMPDVSYVDESLEQLKRMVPLLDPGEFGAGQDHTPAKTPSQDELDFVLSGIGGGNHRSVAQDAEPDCL